MLPESDSVIARWRMAVDFFSADKPSSADKSRRTDSTQQGRMLFGIPPHARNAWSKLWCVCRFRLGATPKKVATDLVGYGHQSACVWGLSARAAVATVAIACTSRVGGKLHCNCNATTSHRADVRCRFVIRRDPTPRVVSPCPRQCAATFPLCVPAPLVLASACVRRLGRSTTHHGT